MAITFGRFCSAVQYALSSQAKADREELARLEAKRRQIEEHDAAVQLKIAVLEADKPAAAARKEAKRQAIEERLEQERQVFAAAAVKRFIEKHGI